MTRRTIYVIVADRRGARLKPAALRRLAADIRAGIPSGHLSRRQGDYVTAGTSLRPEVTGIAGPPYATVALLKVRGDEYVRDVALYLIRAKYRIEAARGHDGTPVR